MWQIKICLVDRTEPNVISVGDIMSTAPLGSPIGYREGLDEFVAEGHNPAHWKSQIGWIFISDEPFRSNAQREFNSPKMRDLGDVDLTEAELERRAQGERVLNEETEIAYRWRVELTPNEIIAMKSDGKLNMTWAEFNTVAQNKVYPEVTVADLNDGALDGDAETRFGEKGRYR